MVKKLFVNIALASTIALVSTPAWAATVFVDVNENYWANKAINKMAEEGLMEGYTNATFKPAQELTRAEFAAVMVKALGKAGMELQRPQNRVFRDVPLSHWAAEEIQAAYQLGLVKGYPNNYYRPNNKVSRAEVLSVLAQAIDMGYMSQAQARQIVMKSFYDWERVPDWAMEAVAEATKADILDGMPNPNYVDAQENATRAQIAMMLYNFMENVNEANIASQFKNSKIAMEKPGVFDKEDMVQHDKGYTGYDNPYFKGNETSGGEIGPAGQGDYKMTGQQENQLKQVEDVDDLAEVSAEGATNSVYLKGNLATIQRNSIIPTVLRTPVSSELSRKGDQVIAEVTKDIKSSDGKLLIPRGSKVYGQVAMVEEAGKVGQNAKIALDFDRLMLPSGKTLQLDASIASEDGVLKGGTAAGSVGKGALRTAGGAAGGAALGTALGAITGDISKGAIYGTAIGGGVGLLSNFFVEGGKIQMSTGEKLFIKLDDPLTINTDQY